MNPEDRNDTGFATFLQISLEMLICISMLFTSQGAFYPGHAQTVLKVVNVGQ